VKKRLQLQPCLRIFEAVYSKIEKLVAGADPGGGAIGAIAPPLKPTKATFSP